MANTWKPNIGDRWFYSNQIFTFIGEDEFTGEYIMRCDGNSTRKDNQPSYNTQKLGYYWKIRHNDTAMKSSRCSYSYWETKKKILIVMRKRDV